MRQFKEFKDFEEEGFMMILSTKTGNDDINKFI